MSQLRAGVGAADTLFQHQRPNNPKRSRFNLNRITNFTADGGMIIPFDWIFCLPGDDVDISFEMILDTLPLINPSLTSYKVLTHWYALEARHTWEGWKTFITRGRSGNVSLQIPRVDLEEPLALEAEFYPYTDDSHKDTAVEYIVKPYGSHSLASFLGVPSPANGFYTRPYSETDGWSVDKAYLPYTPQQKKGETDDFLDIQKTGFNLYRYPNALPFMVYQNICKYNYVPQNLLQDNHSLFPVKGDHDWYLKYDASITNYVDYASNEEAAEDVENPKIFSYDGIYSNSDTVTRLDQLRYDCFDEDYFTSGLPWLQRGDVRSMDINVDMSHSIFESYLDLDGVELSAIEKTESDVENYLHLTRSNGVAEAGNFAFLNEQSSTSTSPSQVKGGNATAHLGGVKQFLERYARSIRFGNTTLPTFNFTANQLRELIAMSVWQERNARVNGSYNSMIYQHWRSNPHGEEHKPTYIGGTADYVNFATILQNSESTSENPLGSTAGRGSTGGKGYVGKYHCNDYTYIMGVMIIKPNTTYMQGVEHHLSCENIFDDFPQPEFEGLSPQSILNKEIFVSTDNSDNEGLFCYQERYVYLKVRQNVNRGLFQCKPDKDRLFGSFTQARWFDEKPTFSYQFLVMSPYNMRRDWLAYPSQPAFKLQTASKISVVRNLAYTSEPNTFGF